jgi:hypothetical protein
LVKVKGAAGVGLVHPKRNGGGSIFETFDNERKEKTVKRIKYSRVFSVTTEILPLRATVDALHRPMYSDTQIVLELYMTSQPYHPARPNNVPS